ncbi:MAG: hypothetical protein R3F59_19865 [Myxococcota bacterium]
MEMAGFNSSLNNARIVRRRYVVLFGLKSGDVASRTSTASS